MRPTHWLICTQVAAPFDTIKSRVMARGGNAWTALRSLVAREGPAARRYFLSGSFAFLRGRLRNTTARKCNRHGFLLEDKLKGKYAA